RKLILMLNDTGCYLSLSFFVLVFAALVCIPGRQLCIKRITERQIESGILTAQECALVGTTGRREKRGAIQGGIDGGQVV
ncbi:MAG: hypothetical protein IIX81_01770, partial [Tidjanibacter sp.]|nr:hypothetical protein [Tidjanibacter sp.]